MVSEKNSVHSVLAGTPKETQFLHEISAEEIKNVLLEPDGLTSPLEEMISAAEAAFEFIKALEIEPGLKNGFWVLEREFEFWRRLVVR